MNIADTSTYTIRVNEDIYYIKNKNNGNLSYSLYKKEQSLSLIYDKIIPPLDEVVIEFEGDGIYNVLVDSTTIEIRYYLTLQSTLIDTIGDFLCDCCGYSSVDYDCSCSTNVDIKCVQFSAVPLMLLSYQHLSSYCLNSCCAAQYLYDASTLYEDEIRESYLGHIRQECIKGKSLYGTTGLKYMTAIYYVLFLEGELESRDDIDVDFIYAKFDYERIRDCMNNLGIEYDKLKNIMGLCDDKFSDIEIKLDNITTVVEDTNEVVHNISVVVGTDEGGGTSGGTIQESSDNIYDKALEIENTIQGCCTGGGNLPPNADAGIDQIIDLNDVIQLDASGSTDPDGTIVSYQWAAIISPITPTISSPTTAVTSISGLSVAGVYVFSLIVTDNNGATGVDSVNITVGTAVPVAINSNVSNNRAGDCASTYTFAESDFDYTPSGNPLESIKIESISGITIGTLEYNSAAITTPLIIAIANIGLLVYTPDNTDTSQHVEPFSFSVKTVASLTQSNIATMDITNGSCATTVSQIQLTTISDTPISCGTSQVVSGVPESNLTQVAYYKIKNTGDAALVGTLTVIGTNAVRFSPDVSVINVPASGEISVTVTIDLVGAGGTSINATMVMTTNSDINSSCNLNMNMAVGATATPPITQTSVISIPRASTCTDIYTFQSSDFLYTNGSPVGRTHIRIDSLPAEGIIKLGTLVLGVDLGVPLQVAEASISDLTYTPDGTNTGTQGYNFFASSSNDGGVTWG